jgi:5-methylthioribose kinase
MLDIEKPDELVLYLRCAGQIGPAETPQVVVLAGGVSNRTVLVRRSSGEAWVLKQALAKLRVAMDWHSSPERVHREAMALRWLVHLAPPGATVPLVFEDLTHHVLAMQAVPEPHQNWKSVLLAGEVSEPLVRQFGALLGHIHRRALEAGPELCAAFEDRSFFESLRLEPYYRAAAERNVEVRPFLEALMAETRAQRLTFVHGDYSPKNILVRDGKLVLLDHEVAHWGDPAFDLGFGLAHLLSKAHHVAARRQVFLDAAGWFWCSYRQQAGPVAEDEAHAARVVRHALGCLLARVDGRSPLEYLTPVERDRQRAAVLRLMVGPPQVPDSLPGRFGEALKALTADGSLG